MSVLREFVKKIISEKEEPKFEEWLSPEIMELLISAYAQGSSKLGALKWKYGSIPKESAWGAYDPYTRILVVNKEKTKGFFRKQVQTILHEIEHWNQHVRIMDNAPKTKKKLDPGDMFFKKYNEESKFTGYTNNPYEVDAQEFANENLKQAMEQIWSYSSPNLTSNFT